MSYCYLYYAKLHTKSHCGKHVFYKIGISACPIKRVSKLARSNAITGHKILSIERFDNKKDAYQTEEIVRSACHGSLVDKEECERIGVPFTELFTFDILNRDYEINSELWSDDYSIDIKPERKVPVKRYMPKSFFYDYIEN